MLLSIEFDRDLVVLAFFKEAGKRGGGIKGFDAKEYKKYQDLIEKPEHYKFRSAFFGEALGG